MHGEFPSSTAADCHRRHVTSVGTALILAASSSNHPLLEPICRPGSFANMMSVLLVGLGTFAGTNPCHTYPLHIGKENVAKGGIVKNKSLYPVVIEKIKALENFQVSFDGGKSVKTFSTKKNWEGISPDVELFLDLHFDFQNILGSEKVTYKITKNTGIFYFYTTKFI